MSRIRASSTIYESSGLTDIQISSPTDSRYSSSRLIITVKALPTDGTNFLADGVTKVSVGETLTVAQLTGLKFAAAPGLFGVSSTFAYSVTDPSGASASGAAAITIAPDSLPPVTTPVSLTVAENANATAIGIAAPIDPNYTASQLTSTVTGLPSDGTVYLADDTTSVSIGQTLTVAQLTGLTFEPTAGVFCHGSSFTYKVSDPSGLSATGAAALIIGPATPAAAACSADPALIVANGASIIIDAPSAAAVTFTGTTGTLKLEAPQTFTGVVSGLSGADAIDLAGFAYGAAVQATYLGNASGGTLTVTDGAETAHLALFGNYLSSTWTLSDDGKGGTTIVDPALPPGVTLQQIDGGPNYYANNGLTYAHNAGWDNPDFFPIGAWAAPIQTTSDATRWAALGWNTAWVPAHANQSVIQAAGISLVISAQSGWTAYTNYGFTPGPETVGIETYDEPNTSAQFYNGMSTIPNSIQDGRFWWVNNTINWLDYGSPATRGTQAAWLGAPQTTPNGSTRTINISSLDYYPFSRNDQYGPPSVSTTWGLSTTATSDQYRRGFFYHDIIDQERLYQPVSAPLMAIVENGGPFTTDTTSATYIQPSEMNWAVWESIIAGAREVMYFNNTFGGPGISNDDMNTAYFQSAQAEASFTGTGSGNSLTVSSITGQIFLGDVVSGTGVPAGTTIVSQIGGTEGGIGVYVTSQAVTASGASLTATQPTSMYAQTAATDALIEQLAPVINSPFAEGYATVNPTSGEKLPLPLAAGTGTSAFSGIDLSVHWYTGGNVSNRGLQLSNGAYIFAATRASEYATNISATFTLADLNATSVTVVNENRTIPVLNGVFADTFATGATIHIYQVNDGSSVNGSPAITAPATVTVGAIKSIAGASTAFQTVRPFSSVTIADANIPAQTETLTVGFNVANGTLSNLTGGNYNTSTGVYTDTGSTSTVTSALEGLVFTPTPNLAAPGCAVTTAFNISVINGVAPATNFTASTVVNYQSSTGNDLTHSSTASGANNFIDLLNFEASYSDLIDAFGTKQSAMQDWYLVREPIENRVERFDGLDYVANYGDLINAFAGAGSMQVVEDAGANHFITNGMNEGRVTTFNGLDYIASYSDLIKAFGADNDAGAWHYIEDGVHEGRTISFDGLDYIGSYGDLIKAFGPDEQAGAVHFITHGFEEGRSITFDGLDYIASYSDLIGAFGANNDAGAAHFIQSGFNEGRTVTFDGLDYIANYSDLMKAFGANNDAGAVHYIQHGFSEDRSTTFDVAGYEAAHPDLIGKYATNDQFLTAYINTYVSTGHFLT
jgi:hypothetical protein